MPRLRESVRVHAPRSFVLASVNTYLLERGASGGATFTLRFPLPSRPISGLTVEKSVALVLDYHQASGASPDILIAWRPDGTRALPAFSGTLSASEGADETSELAIFGDYVPPGALLGWIFDRFIGVHIARATLIALLTQFRNRIEADYHARMMP